jgi:phosphatidylglycerol:prolipoprotein diacylglycerol transferase
MLYYPAIDPIALGLGPVKVHWYGLMYAISFAAIWWLGRRRLARHFPQLPLSFMDDLIFYGAMGVIVGGRVGYMLFYQTDLLLNAPLTLFKVWQGGMSFHGGLLGVITAIGLFTRRHPVPFLALMDFITPLVPIGLAAGRLGNFINGELWGGPTHLPWGMIYPPLGSVPLHPSMLYELLLEGIVLFIWLNWYSRRPRPAGAISGLFLLGYGGFRFLVEFVRIPDAQLGYLLSDWVTMGQLLSLPMMLAGAALMTWAYRRNSASRKLAV